MLSFSFFYLYLNYSPTKLFPFKACSLQNRVIFRPVQVDKILWRIGAIPMTVTQELSCIGPGIQAAKPLSLVTNSIKKNWHVKRKICWSDKVKLFCLKNNVFISLHYFLRICDEDFVKNFTFAWDYHGSFYWGSTVVLRCLPGYQIPQAYASVSAVSLFLYNNWACSSIMWHCRSELGARACSM